MISRKALFRILYFCLFATFANFIAFGICSSIAGGDALKGYESDGSYFVYHSGKYVQVSKDAWYLSRIPGEWLNAMWPLGTNAVEVIFIIKKFGKER